MLYLDQDTNSLNEAEQYLLQAQQLYKGLVQKNSDKYEAEFARTLVNLATFYQKKSQFDEAEHTFQQAREVYETLTQKGIDQYEPEFAKNTH